MATTEAVEATPAPQYLKDYKPPSYLVETLDLQFDLGEESTRVTATSKMIINEDGASSLVLDGDSEIKLLSVSINSELVPADDYVLKSDSLELKNLPSANFTLEIVTQLEPHKNTALEGLYKSSGNFCTQCEANGFRRITYFQDRPDVMAKYTTRITADKAKYPVLLSNGNLIDSGDIDDEKHYALWEDPWNKPCYLFALVAGDLAVLEDSFHTSDGRDIALKIWVEAHNLHKTAFAMESLKKSMKWDEDVYGLVYDLDLFNIVAVDDFNMGAMENKSLNVFNSRCVLASPDTATDNEYAFVEAVVAHEYFHNYTGNRVTCRDWFQLSLKEGLTVFRDQQFSADMNSAGVKRISDVSMLRARQFPEDSGPMAHPIRPESYIKMDNFYTATVYEKGAEVVRMYHTLLGKDGFRKGMDLYFQRHDGNAVTCDDFFAAMADANNVELELFKTWYSQAGTPQLSVSTSYVAETQTFTLTCTQTTPPSPGQASKSPLLMPIRVALLGADGSELPLQLEGAEASAATNMVLKMTQSDQVFKFTGVTEKPIPSILRGFSAPVKLTTDLTKEELIFLLANDNDEFNCWEAGQTLVRQLQLDLLSRYESGEDLAMDQEIMKALGNVLNNATKDGADLAFIAKALTLPGPDEIAEMVEVIDPHAIAHVCKFVRKSFAETYRTSLFSIMKANDEEQYGTEKASRAKRAMKNVCLMYLAKLEDADVAAECYKRYQAADNMTDQVAALSALCSWENTQSHAAIAEFYEQWKNDPLVLIKWFQIQASQDVEGNLENVQKLLDHPDFKITNPNMARSLVGGFASSTTNFHCKDGSGYTWFADMIIKLDDINPQVAARTVSSFSRWRKFSPALGSCMKIELERIMAKPGLSGNVSEIVGKSLES